MTMTTDTRAEMQNTTEHTITIKVTSINVEGETQTGVDEMLFDFGVYNPALHTTEEERADWPGMSGMFYEVDSVTID